MLNLMWPYELGHNETLQDVAMLVFSNKTWCSAPNFFFFAGVLDGGIAY